MVSHFFYHPRACFEFTHAHHIDATTCKGPLDGSTVRFYFCFKVLNLYLSHTRDSLKINSNKHSNRSPLHFTQLIIRDVQSCLWPFAKAKHSLTNTPSLDHRPLPGFLPLTFCQSILQIQTNSSNFCVFVHLYIFEEELLW